MYTLQSLTSEEILGLLQRAVADKERGLGDEKLDIAEGVLERIAIFADGDARAAYNTLEALARAAAPEPEWTPPHHRGVALDGAATQIPALR